MKTKLAAILSPLGFLVPIDAHSAEWAPLISSTFFDGVRADVLLAVAGILGLALIIFGLSMIMRTTGR